MGTDRRRARRQVLGYGARVLSGDGAFEVPCVILDVSERGARLRVADAATVPEEFVLALAPSCSARRTCVVAWRKAEQVGVLFK